MTLAELQREFQQHVLTGAPTMRDLVRTIGKASPARRLAVYAEGYRLRLLEVLSKDFPGVCALAGELRFEDLCRGYIECFPSHNFNARWYGAHFCEYLKRADVAAPESALAEMAALEWALTLAFDAPDLAPLQLPEIAAVPPEDWSRMIFAFHPALVLVAVRSNVADIRRAVDRAQPIPTLTIGASATVAVWRRDLQVYHRGLAAVESAALGLARQGASFSAICESLCAAHPVEEVARHAAELLRRWISEHWIIRLDLRGEGETV